MEFIENSSATSQNRFRKRRLAAKTLTLKPAFATYISKNDPLKNYRTEPTVEVDDDPDRKEIVIGFSGNSFLSQVKSVDLVLDCVDESLEGGTVYESDERINRYVTWNSRPDDDKTRLTELASIGTVYEGWTKSVDISGMINSGRLHSDFTLVIRPESRNGATYKKSSMKLVVRYGEENDDEEDVEYNYGNEKYSGAFQLMMYWERSFFWQESWSRRRWCAACGRSRGDKCKDGDDIVIIKCDDDSREQWWVRDDDRFCAYSDRSLCWDYRTREFELRRRGSSSMQDFVAKPYFSIRKNPNKEHRFELRRRNRSGCVTQLHHPKNYEHLMSRRCDLARNSDTSYWVAVVPKINGH